MGPSFISGRLNQDDSRVYDPWVLVRSFPSTDWYFIFKTCNQYTLLVTLYEFLQTFHLSSTKLLIMRKRFFSPGWRLTFVKGRCCKQGRTVTYQPTYNLIIDRSERKRGTNYSQIGEKKRETNLTLSSVLRKGVVTWGGRGS